MSAVTEPRGIPRWILPVVAGVASLAVGVTGFLVASPFATPKLVEPATVEAAELPFVDAVTPVGEAFAAELSDIPLPITTLTDAEPAADLRATLAEVYAEDEAVEAGEVPDPEVDTSGITVIDPCPEAGGSDADCPTGSRGTVLALTDLPALQVWFSRGGTEDCPVETTTTTVSFRVLTNRPAELTLWFEVDGVGQVRHFGPTAEDRAEWEADAEAGTWRLLVQCVVLDGLPAGWPGGIEFVAVDDDGTVVTRLLTFAADPAPRVPPSWVRPIGRTTLLVSIPTTDVSTVRFRAIAVPFGQPTPSCDFGDDVAGTIEPLLVLDEVVSVEDLTRQNYIPGFRERHTAAFAVPEASTVTVCAGWVDRHSAPDFVIPDHVYSEVYYSPDLALPVVSVDAFEPAPGVRPTVRLTAGIGFPGDDCGSWDATQADAVGAQLCSYVGRDDEPGWESALMVTAEGSAGDSTSTRLYHLTVSPEECGLGCELPETRYVDVPVYSRDPCLGSCEPSYLGTVRLRVDWEHGARSWFGDWTREEAGAPDARAPRFDTRAMPAWTTEVGPDGEQYAVLPIESDVPTTVRVVVERLTEAHPPEVVAEYVDSALSAEHAITIGPLAGGGVYYAFRVELTDADGRTSIYSPLPGVGRTWANGVLRSDVAERVMATQVSVTAPGGGAIVAGSVELLVGGGRWFERRDEPALWCTRGELPFEVETADVVVWEPTSFQLTLAVAPAAGPVAEDAECTSDADLTFQAFRGEIPYADILAGATITVTNEAGYTATIRMMAAD